MPDYVLRSDLHLTSNHTRAVPKWLFCVWHIAKFKLDCKKSLSELAHPLLLIILIIIDDTAQHHEVVLFTVHLSSYNCMTTQCEVCCYSCECEMC